jgi:hypothetical protein
MVILSCEGAENTGTKSTAAREALKDYLDTGGRVFASHYHYVWFKNGPAPLPTTASWVANSNQSSGTMHVDRSFAKGQAFAEWLVEAKASTTLGPIPATQLRRNVTTVPGEGAPAETSLRWLYHQNNSAEDTKFYSFNAPVGTPVEQQCGRGVYTDIHVSSGAGADQPRGTFPNNCADPKPELSPQEKALLFLLMDLASCIQDESKPPVPPPAVN